MSASLPSDAVSLAFTGASGAQYGLRLLECLLGAGHTVHLMLSKPARVVIGTETDLELPGRAGETARYLAERYRAQEGQLAVYGLEEWTAPVASGSGAPRREGPTRSARASSGRPASPGRPRRMSGVV